MRMQDCYLVVHRHNGALDILGPTAAQLGRALGILEPDPDVDLELSHEDETLLRVRRTGEASFYLRLERPGEPAVCVYDQSFAHASTEVAAFAAGDLDHTRLKWELAGDEAALVFVPLTTVSGDAPGSRRRKYRYRYRAVTRAAEVAGLIAYYDLADWWLAAFSAAERRLIEKVEYAQRSEEILDADEFTDWSDAIIGDDGEEDEDEDTAPAEGDPYRDRRISLTQGAVTHGAQDVDVFLCGLVALMTNPQGHHVTGRLADKVLEILDAQPLDEQNVLHRHTAYSTLMVAYYRNREKEPGAFDKAVRVAEQMVAIAPEAASMLRRAREEAKQHWVHLSQMSADDEDAVSSWAELCDHLPWHDGFKQLAIIRAKQGDLEEALRLSREAQAQGWGGDWEQRIARYEQQLARRKNA